jgi:cation transport ATPase
MRNSGAGAAGVVAGSRVLLGAPEFLIDHGVDLMDVPPMETDWTTLFVAVDGRFAGVVRVEPG